MEELILPARLRKNVLFSDRLFSLLKEPIKVKLRGEYFTVRLKDTFLDRMQKLPSGDWVTPLQKEEFDCFCYNRNNKITYWPTRQGEQPLNEQGKWRLEGRQEMKPGRFLCLLRKHLRAYTEYNDEVLNEDAQEAIFLRTCEIFTDRVRGINTTLDIKISDKPSKVYAMPIHPEAGEHLQKSCMGKGSEHECSQYAKFYDTIPGLKCVYQEAEGQLLMRALLWTETKTGLGPKEEKITFLDRIYGSIALHNRLIEYAKEQGWAWRTFYNNDITLGDKHLTLYQHLDKKMLRYLETKGCPYIDTMAYVDDSVSYLVSRRIEDDMYQLKETTGDPFDWFHQCEICGKRKRKNEMVRTYTYFCTKCAKKKYFGSLCQM